MPPKQSTNPTTKLQGPTKKELEAINTYLAQKPDFDQLLKNSPKDRATSPKVDESPYYRKLREVIGAADTK